MLLDILSSQRLFFDGATGTQLIKNGLLPGELPETWNLTHPEIIAEIHRSYYNAGSDIICTNTFGANGLKHKNVCELITSAVKIADSERRAAEQRFNANGKKFIVLDVGPLGMLLKPFGELEFETAVSLFGEMIKAGVDANRSLDAIFFETFTDIYELKAAIIAAKENSSLPIFASCVFDDTGHLMTGADAGAVVALCEGLGASAIGANCGVGPKLLSSVLNDFAKYSSLPIIVKPNAGLPSTQNGITQFELSPEAFSTELSEASKITGSLLGGCCGTTPEHIRMSIEKIKNIPYHAPTAKNHVLVSSYSHALEIGNKPILIGERINPTGKNDFKEALRRNDMSFILKQADLQQKAGAQILDVNVGLPGINEVNMMTSAVAAIQSVIDLPLQIDSSSPEVIESAMRIVCGKPIINSVNGKVESMSAIFPIAKKYGAVVIGLTLDEHGIPDTAEKRFLIAERIVKTANEYGIEKKNILIDPLTLTVATDGNSAKVTLDTLRMIRNNLNVGCCLGVSNISFGLPDRDRLNSSFFMAALSSGLNAPIMNPLSVSMMKTYHDYMALFGFDNNCAAYIEDANKQAKDTASNVVDQKSNCNDLQSAVMSGLKNEASILAKELLSQKKPMEIIDQILIPALNKVGDRFSKKELFLPQLLMSAESAGAAFDVIRNSLSIVSKAKKEKIILATVKGDIHDIGKNIVRTLLENYNYEVIDLGRDVPTETIIESVINNDVQLVGLSALMTTTIPAMEETIRELKMIRPNIHIMVGGAVLTNEYADSIGADHYSPDAMDSVYYAEKLFGH